MAHGEEHPANSVVPGRKTRRSWRPATPSCSEAGHSWLNRWEQSTPLLGPQSPTTSTLNGTVYPSTMLTSSQSQPAMRPFAVSQAAPTDPKVASNLESTGGAHPVSGLHVCPGPPLSPTRQRLPAASHPNLGQYRAELRPYADTGKSKEPSGGTWTFCGVFGAMPGPAMWATHIGSLGQPLVIRRREACTPSTLAAAGGAVCGDALQHASITLLAVGQQSPERARQSACAAHLGSYASDVCVKTRNWRRETPQSSSVQVSSSCNVSAAHSPVPLARAEACSIARQSDRTRTLGMTAAISLTALRPVLEAAGKSCKRCTCGGWCADEA